MNVERLGRVASAQAIVLERVSVAKQARAVARAIVLSKTVPYFQEQVYLSQQLNQKTGNPDFRLKSHLLGHYLLLLGGMLMFLVKGTAGTIGGRIIRTLKEQFQGNSQGAC